MRVALWQTPLEVYLFPATAGPTGFLFDSGLPNKRVYCVLRSGTKIFAATDSGLYSNSNGMSWTWVDFGASLRFRFEKYVYAIASDGSNLFAGTGGGIFQSADSGKSWTYDSTLPYQITCFGSSDSAIFAGVFGGSVFLSTNNGVDWIERDSGLTASFDISCFATAHNGTGGTNLYAGTIEEFIFLRTMVHYGPPGIPDCLQEHKFSL